jgi:hypothetical protein
MKAMLVVLLAVVPTLLFAAVPERVISQTGNYVVGDAGEKIEVTFKDRNIKISRQNGGVVFPAYAGWLLYSDSTTVLWLYDGAREIRSVSLDADGIGIRESHDMNELWAAAPKRFLEAIPGN